MAEIVHRNKSLEELHQHLGYPKPKHPLISLLDPSQLEVPVSAVDQKSASDLYLIDIKDKNCGSRLRQKQLRLQGK